MKKGSKAAIIILIIAIIISLGAYGYKQYKIDQIRTDSISQIKTNVKIKDYRKAEQKKVKKIIKNAEAKIGKEKNSDKIASIKKDAIKSIKRIKTENEIEQEKLKKEKEAKKKEQLEQKKKQIKKKTTQDSVKTKQNNIPSSSNNSVNNSNNNTNIQEPPKTSQPSSSEVVPNQNTDNNSNAGGCIGDDKDNFY